MTFSDWLTVISILAAVLLVAIKMFEWKVISMKNPLPFFGGSIIFLLASGVSAFFQTHPPPNLIRSIFFIGGFSSGVWSIIWLVIFLISLSFSVRKFRNRPLKSNEELLNYYMSLLRKDDKSRFEYIFFKYENAFFRNPDTWNNYGLIMEEEGFWELLSMSHFHFIAQNRDSLQKMDRAKYIHKTLLRSQIKNFPKSLLTKELEEMWNSKTLQEVHSTPILQIFLGDKATINFVIEERCFLSVIKEESEKYFNSPDFEEKDKRHLSYEEPTGSNEIIAPLDIKLFYFIKLVNIYQSMFFKERIKVNDTHIPCFPIDTWLSKLKRNNDSKDENLYLRAIGEIKNIYHFGFYFTSNEPEYEQEMKIILKRRTSKIDEIIS